MNERIIYQGSILNYYSDNDAHTFYNGGTTSNSTLPSSIVSEGNISLLFHKNMQTLSLSLICVISSPSSSLSGSVDISVNGLDSNVILLHRDRLSDTYNLTSTTLNAMFSYPINETRGFILENIDLTTLDITINNFNNINTVRVHSNYGDMIEHDINVQTNFSFQIEENLSAPDVVFNPPPDIYDTNINVNGYLNNGETFVFDTGINQPVIAEYIGYDTQGKELIAVAQDGLGGNIYFDSGFPKFYNNNWNSNWATFNDMNVSYKLLYNAMNFTFNQQKLNSGNNKVLILCDKEVGQSYSLDYQGSGFLTSFEGITNVLGVNPTFRSANEFTDNILDLDYDYLKQFISIVFLSTNSSSTPRVSENLISSILTFRSMGNGLIFITDHGSGTVNDYTDSGFYRSANEIIKEFDAFFYGNVATSTTNIGYLRTNYGDHPLYNNLDDTEEILGITSVSEISINELPEYTVFPNLQITDDGFYNIKVLIKDTDGSIKYQTYTYGKNISAPFKYIDDQGNDYVAPEGSYKNKANINIEYNTTEYDKIKGLIKSGSNITGEVDITNDVGFNREVFYNFKNEVFIPNNSFVSVETTLPVSYLKSYVTNRKTDEINELNINRISTRIQKYEFENENSIKLMKRFNTELGYDHQISLARQRKLISKHMNDEIPYGYPTTINISQNDTGKVFFTELFSNNTVPNNTFHSVKESINCVYTVENDGISITPTTGAFTDCGLILNIENNEFGFYEDYIFVKVDPLSDIEGLVYNTYDFMEDNFDSLLQESFESLSVRNTNYNISETDVFWWYKEATQNSWDVITLRNNIKTATINAGFTFYDDYNTGLTEYYNEFNTYESFIKFFIGDTEIIYSYDLQNKEFIIDNTTDIRQYYNTSRKIINTQTEHEFFITPERFIMYDFVSVQNTINIQQGSFQDVLIDDIMSNDTPDNSTFESLVSSTGCDISLPNSNTLRIQPTVRKGETSYFNYTGKTIFDNIGTGRQDINVTELDSINAVAFDDTEIVDVFKYFISPPSSEVILQEWHRTDGADYYTDPSTIPTEKEASLWYIDGSNNFVQPNNTAYLNTILSPETYDIFDFEVTLQSSSTDNDYIGLVAAGDYINNEYIAIIVGVHTGGLSSSRFSINFYEGSTAANFGVGTEIVGNNFFATQSGWNDSYIKVRVERNGDIITAYCSDYNGNIDFGSELSIDLNNLGTKEQLLKGSHRYGYATMSQPDSKYLNYDFQSDDSINISTVYDLNTDERFIYSNGSWVLNDTARNTLDYPRNINNTYTDQIYRLDFTTSSLVEDNSISGTYSENLNIGNSIDITRGTTDTILSNFTYNSETIEIIAVGLFNNCSYSLVGDTYTITKDDIDAYFWIHLETSSGISSFKKIFI